MSAPTLNEMVAMVADVYEVDAIHRTQAVIILHEATGLSTLLAARLLAQEMADRRRETRRRDRAAEQAMRDDDGTWG